MQDSFSTHKLTLASIRELEQRPPQNENEPFKEKYDARERYLAEFDKLQQSGDASQESLFVQAVLIASVGQNHFDTDENHDAGNRCRQSLELWARLSEPRLLFEGANWICTMLNFLGFHAVFGERFYEGILCLDAAEKIYKAVKRVVRAESTGFGGSAESCKEAWKQFLKAGFICAENKIKIGEYLKNEILAKLKTNLKKIHEMANDPEGTKTSSELIAETRSVISQLNLTASETQSPVALGKWPEFCMEQCEENYIQSVFFQAQVYGKLLEKDLSAEYCGLTLQRQYFKFLVAQAQQKSQEASKTSDAADEGQIKESKEEPMTPQTSYPVADFDYKDFINNSMGLCMYYSEKLMFQQGARLLSLADEVLGPGKANEHEEITMLRASLLHMKANVLRDFFMFTCLSLKESGAVREESKRG